MNKCDACGKCIKYDIEKDNSLRCNECKEIDEPVYLKRKKEKADFKYNWLTQKYEPVEPVVTRTIKTREIAPGEFVVEVEVKGVPESYFAKKYIEPFRKYLAPKEDVDFWEGD